MKSRINDLGKVLRGMKVLSCSAMGMKVKRRLYEGVAATTALYGAETLSMTVAEKNKLNKRDEVSEEYMWSNVYGPSEK